MGKRGPGKYQLATDEEIVKLAQQYGNFQKLKAFDSSVARHLKARNLVEVAFPKPNKDLAK